MTKNIEELFQKMARTIVTHINFKSIELPDQLHVAFKQRDCIAALYLKLMTKELDAETLNKIVDEYADKPIPILKNGKLTY